LIGHGVSLMSRKTTRHRVQVYRKLNALLPNSQVLVRLNSLAHANLQVCSSPETWDQRPETSSPFHCNQPQLSHRELSSYITPSRLNNQLELVRPEQGIVPELEPKPDRLLQLLAALVHCITKPASLLSTLVVHSRPDIYQIAVRRWCCRPF